jgi:hypothetical protein
MTACGLPGSRYRGPILVDHSTRTRAKDIDPITIAAGECVDLLISATQQRGTTVARKRRPCPDSF